jgi:23S rRNA (cytidine2498-2'-O)-methyltransferase
VIRLARFLKPGGLVIFTLKVPRIEGVAGPCAMFRKTAETARATGLHLFAQTHLTYNRHEFTMFFERAD